VIQLLNIANDNILVETEANDAAPISGFLSTTEANDTAAVADSITALSKWASLSSYELSETGQASGVATPLAAFIWAGLFDLQGNAAQFAFQGNAAQFDLQRKTPMPGSDELTDAKIEAAEARTDTKIERLGGKIDTLGIKLDTVNQKLADQTKDRNLIIGTIVVSAISIAILLIGLATYGDAIFGRGMNVRDVVHAVIQEQQEIQKRETTQPPAPPPNVGHQ
jgi:hypothetical protein